MDTNDQENQDQLPDDLMQQADLAATGEISNDDEPKANAWPVSNNGMIVASQITGMLQVIATGWQITDYERAALNEPLAQVISTLLPDGVGGNPYLTLVLTAGMIAAPRIMSGQPFRLPPPDHSQHVTNEHVNVSQPVASNTSSYMTEV